MINLFKKNFPSFLSFNTTSDTTTATAITTTTSTGDYKFQLQRPCLTLLGLGLINATRDTNRTLNILESAQLKKSNNFNSPRSPSKRNGFIDEIRGEVDGLMSCTESLGFESSDERRVNEETDQIHGKNDNGNEHDDDDNDDNKKEDDDDDHVWRRRMMISAEGRGNNWNKKMRSFPPPLSWLNRNGKPSFVLRPVRKDGRLELTEVRIHRPEILHASRHDGRLTLHLIPDHSIEEEEELDALLDEEEMMLQEEQEELDSILDEEIMVDDEEEEEKKEEKKDEVVEGIRYGKEEEERVDMRCNEGLRRCYEMVNQHHHHHVHGSHHNHHLRMCGINISVPC